MTTLTHSARRGHTIPGRLSFLRPSSLTGTLSRGLWERWVRVGPCTCGCGGEVVVNETRPPVSRLDPTHTTQLRARFAAEMGRRFEVVSALVQQAVVRQDVFGLDPAAPGLPVQLAAGPAMLPRRAFAFKRSSEKVGSFMEWLRAQNEAKILEVGREPGGRRAVVGDVRWASVYVDSAYKQGLKRGDAELRKRGITPSRLPENRNVFQIDSRFNTPIHADRLGLIYTRVYSELKGITDAMEQVISRTLSQAIAEGRNPRQIGRYLQKVITGRGETLAIRDSVGRVIPSKRRAQMLARTEVIRAHHVATINTYREAGIAEVVVQAEWLTAGDDRVCDECASLQGKVFTLDEIEGMIPLHPLCRCVALPKLPAAAGVRPKPEPTPVEEVAKEAAAVAARRVEKQAEAGKGSLWMPADMMAEMEKKTFQLSDRAVKADLDIVWVDVKAMDRAYALDQTAYIARGGAGATGEKYADASRYFRTNLTLDMPEASFTQDGRAVFTDGKHRFAWMRDAGATEVPVALDASSLEYAKKAGVVTREEARNWTGKKVRETLEAQAVVKMKPPAGVVAERDALNKQFVDITQKRADFLKSKSTGSGLRNPMLLPPDEYRQYLAIQREQWKIEERMKALDVHLTQSKEEVRKGLQALLTSPVSGKANVVFKETQNRTLSPSVSAFIEEEQRKAKEWLGQFLGKEAADALGGKVEVEVTLIRGHRAFCQGKDLHMCVNNHARTYVHEFGHALEGVLYPSLAPRSRQHLWDRVSGEKSQTLRKLTGNKAYKRYEVARKDEFADPYTGKIYTWPVRTPTSAKDLTYTEVLSMGLEEMYTDPVNLMKTDPRLFDFVFDCRSAYWKRSVTSTRWKGKG